MALPWVLIMRFGPIETILNEKLRESRDESCVVETRGEAGDWRNLLSRNPERGRGRTTAYGCLGRKSMGIGRPRAALGPNIHTGQAAAVERVSHSLTHT